MSTYTLPSALWIPRPFRQTFAPMTKAPAGQQLRTRGLEIRILCNSSRLVVQTIHIWYALMQEGCFRLGTFAFVASRKCWRKPQEYIPSYVKMSLLRAINPGGHELTQNLPAFFARRKCRSFLWPSLLYFGQVEPCPGHILQVRDGWDDCFL